MIDHDDVLRRFTANWAESLEVSMHAIGGRVLRTPAAVALDAGRPAGLQNSLVLLEQLREAAAPSLFATVHEFFAFETATQAGTVHLFSAWPVPDLVEYGWGWVEPMPLMLRQAGGEAQPGPPELRISKVDTEAELHHFEQVMIEGFPVPELRGLPPGSVFGPALLDDPRFHCWLGWHGGEPVSAAASFIAHGLVDLTFLATLPHARGRGFCSALARTATMLDPSLPAMVIASQEGQPLYTRLGYRHLLDMPLWMRERP